MMRPLLMVASLTLALSACGQSRPLPNMTDIKGVMPALDFAMTRANDGAQVTAYDYRGKVSVLYFGYTHCPDVCPTTLSNLSRALGAMGNDANKIRVLFVSVDPSRDTLPVLKSYVTAFATRGCSTACAAQTTRLCAWRGVIAWLTAWRPHQRHTPMTSPIPILFFSSTAKATHGS